MPFSFSCLIVISRLWCELGLAANLSLAPRWWIWDNIVVVGCCIIYIHLQPHPPHSATHIDCTLEKLEGLGQIEAHFEPFWSTFQGFLGVNWTQRHPWGRPMETFKLLTILPWDGVCEIGLASHSALGFCWMWGDHSSHLGVECALGWGVHLGTLLAC